MRHPTRGDAARVVLICLVAALYAAPAAGGAAGASAPRGRLAAVSYSTGWNLVSGPEGSTLNGATGPLYTLRSGDAGYERLPSDSTLHAGWGYWAYFATGGSLLAAPSTTNVSLDLPRGEWTLAGNPSAEADAYPANQDGLLLFAGGSYLAGVALPPGQGGWVLGRGRLSIVAQDPRSFPLSALAAAALRADDLPGYNPLDASAGFSMYDGSWLFGDRTDARLSVQDILNAEVTVEAARAFMSGAAEMPWFPAGQYIDARPLGSQGVGDEDLAFFATNLHASSFGTGPWDEYVIAFRRGNVTVLLTTDDTQGNGSLARLLDLARRIDGRLQAAMQQRAG